MISILDLVDPGRPHNPITPSEPSSFDGTTALVIGVALAVVIIAAVVVAVVLKNKKNANN